MMRKNRKFLSLCLCVVCLVSLSGCGKDAEVPEATHPEETLQSQTLPSSEPDIAMTFDYAPGSMGIYVKADPAVEAGPEVLDGISMTLSDQKATLTRARVSNAQFDFVKNGVQIGGFVLVDIPREKLETQPQSWAEFESIAGLIASQVMADVYPSQSHISGGGHIDFGFAVPVCMTFMVLDNSKHQYIHNIYVGETYIYDFWQDTAWLADSGETIMSTLSAADIKPELNQATAWSIHDFADYPGVS